MVELEKKLMDILELRKETFTGEDIRHVVDSIMIARSYVEPKEIDKDAVKPEQILKDWMGE